MADSELPSEGIASGAERGRAVSDAESAQAQINHRASLGLSSLIKVVWG